MAVQERNSEMVEILSADFIRKTDTAYLSGIYTGVLISLPGIVSFWPMSVSLSDSTDIFPDYAYLPGRAGGQTLNGGINSGDDLTLRSTAHATKGNIFFGTSTYDEVNNRLGVKTASPARSGQFGGTVYITAGDGNWTTSTFPKLLELAAEGAIQWLKGGGSISRGMVFSADGTLYFVRSTADDASAAATFDMTLSSAGALQPTIAGEAWTNLSFGTGWTNYGSTYQTGQYKKFGDLVLLRGLVARTSGVGTVIANLPAGYRPATSNSTVLFDIITDTGAGRADLDSAGNLTHIGGGTAWVSLNDKFFSIS